MKEFQLDKNGLVFVFRNPSVEGVFQGGTLYYEFKIVGVKENKINDGFFKGAEYNPHKNTINVGLFEVDKKKYSFVSLPENLITKEFLEEKREEYRQSLINQDFKYTLNDTTSYGIYNGISELDIRALVFDIASNFKLSVLDYDDKEIVRRINFNVEIKKIAEKSYIPYPENSGWSDEYKTIHRKMVDNKTAPGYGMIPNSVVKEIVTDMLYNIASKKIQKERDIEEIFQRAKETGEKQLLRTWSREVDEEDNNIVFYYEYAMPDGSTKTKENRAY